MGENKMIKLLNLLKEILSESDPKTGTGKKPKGSDRRLYTDENPNDTVSIKFKTAQDIRDTLSKDSFKSKKHARQSQIINLIHQRVRAAYAKAKDPEVKSRLKRALDYIENRKESSKNKTKSLNENQNIPKSGESSGKPAIFKQNSKPTKTSLMNINQIIKNIDTIPYYKEVLDDVKNNDYSWGVTKKVKEYADYMIKNPQLLKNLPPIIVVDGKLQDGAHRISSIFLIKNLLDKNNDFWGKFKMNVQFWDSNDLDNGDYTFISEIKRTTSLVDGKIDYNQFVDWAKGESDKITKSIDNFSGFGFQWAENNDGVKLIIYKDESPICYVGLNKFANGYKISTLGVKDSARGLGVATKAYDYIINKTILYSDKMQTPEARKLWVKLFKKYKVMGYNKKDNKYFEVEPTGDELKPKDSKYKLYSEKENNNYLVIKR